MKKIPEGWTVPGKHGLNKSHYFIGQSSLCDKWFVLNLVTFDKSDPTVRYSNRCAACYKKLLKLETASKSD